MEEMAGVVAVDDHLQLKKLATSHDALSAVLSLEEGKEPGGFHNVARGLVASKPLQWSLRSHSNRSALSRAPANT